MLRVAVLIDGGFFIKRYRALIDKAHSATPKKVAQDVNWLANSHCNHTQNKTPCYLYRILYYDCPPFGGTVYNPITQIHKQLDKTDVFAFQTALHTELVKVRKLALRRGELKDRKQWAIRADALKALVSGNKTLSDLNQSELRYNLVQKMVDMKIGLDIATLTYEKLAERIVLVSGDSDFVPAAKLARRKGIDFILDPLWADTADSLNEHVDGIRSVWKKPQKPRPKI